MDESQMARFEFFMRSHLNKKAVKDVMNNYIDNKNIVISDEMAISVAGLAKVFVGEIMDISSEIAKAKKHRGVKSEHIL